MLFLLTMLNALVLMRGRATAAPMAKAVPAVGQDSGLGTAMAQDAKDHGRASPA